MQSNNLKSFNYVNDHFLLDKLISKSTNYITAYKLIGRGVENGLTLDGKTLNLVSALIKKSDFSEKLPLHHTPYAYIKLNYIRNLLNNLSQSYTEKKHLNLRRIFSNYMDYKITIQWKDYNNWFEHGCFPLLFLRVLAVIHSRYSGIDENKLLKDIFLNIDGITDSRRQSFFNPPKKLGDLLTKPIFYLVGISLGDGSLLRSEERLSVTDGHSNKKHLTYSYEHLVFVKNLIKKHFSIRCKISKGPGNKFVLVIINKFFVRYLNFFLDIPFGKKKILRVPSIIKLTSGKQGLELKKVFYRGFFDCEGSVIKNSINIQIGTISTILMQDLYGFLKKRGLSPTIRTYYRGSKRNSLTNIFIPSKDYLKFALNVGFLHPLKKQLLINGLRKGPVQKEFKGLKSNYSIGNYIPFEKIDNLYIKDAEEIFKDYRINMGLSQKDLGKRINTTRAAISSWERGINNIPFSVLLKLAYFNGKSKENLIEDLKRINTKYLYGSYSGGKLVRIPFKITEKLVLLAKFFRPLEEKVYVKRRGNKFKKDIDNFFNIKLETNKKEDYVSSLLLRDIFRELCVYEVPWKPLNDKQIMSFEKNYKI